MRLGGSIFEASKASDLDLLIEPFDTYGLSAATGPWGFDRMEDEVLIEFGEHAKELGMVIGETHSRVNLLTPDSNLLAERIELLHEGLRKAELMEAQCVCMLVGTAGPEDHLAAPDAFNYTDAAKKQFREAILKATDGLHLEKTSLMIEPWPNTFFYQPDDILECLEGIGHPKVGLHLDLMNMIDQYHYYKTTEFINEVFDKLGKNIGCIHFKDLRWDWEYMYMKFDEVPVGKGIIDYQTYVSRTAELDENVACYVEHFPTEGDFAVSFAKLHQLADNIGKPFIRRKK